MYSIRIGQYKGFGQLVPEELDPIMQSTSAFVAPLRQAKIKCNTCTRTDGNLRYSHPYNKPVVSFDDLQGIFEVGSNVIEGSLQYKYCDDVNNGVCQDYAPYCSDAPAGKEVPDESVKPSIRRYIRANLAAFGTGPASAKGDLPSLPTGAIYPYYQCLAKYGKPDVVANVETQWFAFMRDVVALNQTACV